MTELHRKYPHIVLPTVAFDAAVMERLRVDGELVAAYKRKCIRCGGERHQLDTRGFCRPCKEALGMPGAPRRKLVSGSEEDRDWERQQRIASSKEVTVSADFIDWAWERLPENVRQGIMLQVWRHTPLPERAKYIAEAVKPLRGEGFSEHMMAATKPVGEHLEAKDFAQGPPMDKDTWHSPKLERV